MITKIFNIKNIISYDNIKNEVISSNPDHIIVKNKRIHKINFSSQSNEKVECEINANNSTITPGFIDSHTHLIFSSNRANDFSKRISGSTYLDIANSGGGIKSSIKSLRISSKEEIIEK